MKSAAITLCAMFLLSACPADEPVEGSDAGIAADGGDQAPSDAGSEPQGPACQRDLQLLNSLNVDLVTCRDLSSCPCGSRCEERRCVADCHSADDCADGKACSLFGECVDDPNETELPAAAEYISPDFQVMQTSIVTPSPENSYAVHVRVGDVAIPSLRFVASIGAEVSCDDGQAYQRYCSLTDLGRLSERSIAFRAAAGSDQSAWSLQVIAPGRVKRVTLSRVEIEVEELPTAGLYRGWVELGADERLPVTLRLITVSARSAYAVIVDETGNLFGGDAGGLSKSLLTLNGNRYAGDIEPMTLASGEYGMAFNLAGSIDTMTIDSGKLEAGIVLEMRHGAHSISRRGLLRARWRRALISQGQERENLPPEIVAQTIVPLSGDPEFSWGRAVNQQIASLFDDWKDAPDFGWREQGSLALCGGPTFEPFYSANACSDYARNHECRCPVNPTCFGNICSWSCSYPVQSNASCDERILCYRGDEANVNAPAFVGENASFSRNPLCAGDQVQQVFPGLFARDDRNASAQLGELVAACLAELAPSEPESSGSAARQIRALLSPATCFSKGRFFSVLERVMGSSDPRKTTILQYLIAGWLRSHSLIASEVRRAQSIVDLHSAPGEDMPAPEAVARQLVRGWDLILHPRLRQAIEHIAQEQLDAPDYRAHRLSGATSASDSQRQGLALVMAETLIAQLDFHSDWLLDRRHVDPAEFDAAQSKTFFARSAFLAQFINALAERSSPAAAWGAKYRQARNELAEARSRLAEQLRLLRTGDNPLGISDADLPLKFERESSGGAARYFSSLDWFLSQLNSELASVRAAQTSARQAYRDEQEQQYRSFSYDLVGGQMRDRYVAQFAGLCGSNAAAPAFEPTSQADPEALLSTCFLDANRPQCAYDEDAIFESLTQDDFAFQICYAAELKKIYGAEIELGDDELDAFMDAAAAGTVEQAVERGIDAWDGDENLGKRVLNALSAALPRANPSPKHRQQAKAVCAAQLPAAQTELPRPPAGPAYTNCFKGSLGEMALGVLLAAEQIQTARAQVVELTENYDHAMRGCLIRGATNEQMAETIGRHDLVMQGLNVVKTAADIIASGGEVNLNPVSWFGATGKAVSATLSGIMTAAEREHQSALGALQRESSLKQCYHGAQSVLISMRSASNRIEEQYIIFERARTQFGNAVAGGARAIRAARAELRRFAATPTGHLAQRSSGQDIQAFRRIMISARRYAYLTVRSLESTQQSSRPQLRRHALSLRNADDLQSLFTSLRAERNGETVNGLVISDRRTVSVISLRDHLLLVGDRVAGETMYHNLSAEQRLGVYLSREEHAVYDSDGQLIGYRVPFTLIPPDLVHMSTPHAVASDPLFNGDNCAERLWSIAVSLTGPSSVNQGTRSLPQVGLQKSNTFMSRLCSGASEDDPFYSESARPWRNLFGEDGQNRENAARPYTAINFQVLHNVSVESLNGDAVGSDKTLAGMGLFGDYALFFSKQSLASSRDPAGLHLQRIEDILLRFEYISAAR
ncbi:MAG: hypothetical protein OSB21_05980 [Myxococcota bacterium]|nr:hypothetical protein [Myxococcota bacterium]